MNDGPVPDAGTPRSKEDHNQVKTIGRDYSFLGLLKFSAYPIITQVAITLLQTVDDGLFLSRYEGEEALASFSICFSVILLMDAIASLFCGTNPYCSMLMGEKQDREASSIFTTMAIICVLSGTVICALLRINTRAMLTFLGATPYLMADCLAFLNVNLWVFPFTILSTFLNRFYVVAGKHQLTIVTTIINAFCNFFFDWLFIVRRGMGIKGAAYADAIATAVLVLFGIIVYSSGRTDIGFALPDKNVLKVLKKVIPYGIPQMFTSLTVSVNSVISNKSLIAYGGETCVSAYTIVSNITYVFMSAFYGFSSAVCPLTSYAYGERNRDKLVRLLKQIVSGIIVISIIVILLFIYGDSIMIKLYITKDTETHLIDMVRLGLKAAPLAFLFYGFNVLAQDVFNAINDNSAASVLAIAENLILRNATILILPALLGLNGVWFAFSVAEALSFLFVVFYAVRDRNKYGYGKSGIATELDTPPIDCSSDRI